MDRMISLSVGIKGVEDYLDTFQGFSDLAKSLVENHDYVNVSVSKVDESLIESEPEHVCEDLYHDENTLAKVHRALMEAGAPYGLGEQHVTDMIHCMQNAGIFFRERNPS